MLLCHLYTRQPLSDSCEALLSCDVIHHNHTISLAKELFGDASISAGEGNRQKRKCYVFTGTLENSDNTHCVQKKASETFSNSHVEVQENKNNFTASLLLNYLRWWCVMQWQKKWIIMISRTFPVLPCPTTAVPPGCYPQLLSLHCSLYLHMERRRSTVNITQTSVAQITVEICTNTQSENMHTDQN